MRYALARVSLAAGVAAVFALAAPATARADEACWKALDAAIAHRAAAVLPAYVAYSVRRTVTNGSAIPLVTDQRVVFRTGDGMADVVDSLYGDAERYTNRLEPGPPFLGPPDALRAGWIAGDEGTTIASVHAHQGKACDDLGPETLNGVAVEHLRVTPHRDGAPGIRDLWIDGSDEIRRAVVAQYLDGASIAGLAGALLARCTIDVQEVQGQAVVRSVTFELPSYHIGGEYRFDGYRFSATPPDGTFAE